MNKKCPVCNGKKTIENPEYAEALEEELKHHEDTAPSFAIAEMRAAKSVKVPKIINCPQCNVKSTDKGEKKL